jgi:hypothetical protein
VYSKLGTVIVIAALIFPFAAVITSVAQSESVLTTVVAAAIALIFFAVLLIASRITIEPEPEAAAGTPREPTPPIAWSWDGTNRQQAEDDDTTETNA